MLSRKSPGRKSVNIIKEAILKTLFVVILLCGLLFPAFSQDTDYSQIVVHIWGEVLRPGEYRVTDGTDILGLISKAGGPSESANLGKVRLTRTLNDGLSLTQYSPKNSTLKIADANLTDQGDSRVQKQFVKRVIKLNINKYLETDSRINSLPVLQAGDVVYVPRNNLSTWKTFASIVRDVAIVANAYFWFRRASN